MASEEAPAAEGLTPLRIAGIYLVVGGVWIVASDWFVASLPLDQTLTTSIQTVKGWVFVGASSVLIYVLVARSRRQLRAVNVQLRRALEQSSVLHRVLRHNLRNACNVIELKARELARSTDAETTADRAIERRVEALLELSEKSRHLRQIALGEQERQPVDLVGVIEAEAAAVSERYPGATVDVEAPETARATAYPEIEFAVRELLENAVEHYESPDGEGAQVDTGPADPDDSGGPTIRVRVRETDEGVVVDVADDGPGLPEMERAVIERGMEHPLSHSEGLGLWIVRAIVSESGGELRLADADGGTTISLELPRAGADDLSARVPITRQTV